MPSDWNCDCGELNFGNRLRCRICNKKRYNAPLNGLVHTRMGDWECVCGILNFNNRFHCYKCGKQKGYDTSITTRDTDWKCSCGVSNFQCREKCYKCGVEKTLTTTQSENTVSFKPGDWHCVECNEMNFRSRSVCFKCGVNKKSSEQPSSEKLEESDECVVCMDKKKLFAIVKCGHLCFCEDCGRNLEQCPMCRIEYNPNTDLLRVYS